jgi:hypothetical protein
MKAGSSVKAVLEDGGIFDLDALHCRENRSDPSCRSHFSRDALHCRENRSDHSCGSGFSRDARRVASRKPKHRG